MKTNVDRLRDVYEKSNRRYVVFVCAFFIHVVGLGVPSAMLGIIYVDVIKAFDASASEAVLMQSLFRGITFGGGIVGDLLMRQFGSFPCTICGSVLAVVCLFSSSFAENMTTIVFLVGIGAGFGLIFPTLTSMISVGKAFPKESASTYLAFVFSGGGVGLVVTPYICQAFLSYLGWRGTFMMFSGIVAHLILLGLVIHLNLPPDKETTDGKSNDWFKQKDKLLRNLTYMTFLLIIAFLGAFGFVESWFLPDFVVSKGYSSDEGALLLTVVGASNLLGRIVAGLIDPLCRKTKIIYHWIYLFLLTALAHATFPFLAERYSYQIGASVIYGLSFGIILAQCGPVIYQTLELDLYPLGQALDNTIYGVFTSLGGPICGFIRDMTGGYDLVFNTASLSALFSSLCCLMLLFYDVIYNIHQKNNIAPITQNTHL